jgi:hypothetical protein
MKSILLLFLTFAVYTTATQAQPYKGLITGEDVARYFTFAQGETLKYDNFDTKRFPTATFVWGKADKLDKKRLEIGGKPSGNILMIIYAEGKSAKDFDRVLKSYNDAVVVKDVGTKAVWSERRRQLSFMTDKFLIVHINIEDARTKDRKAKAIEIAGDILKRLKKKK